MGSSGHFHRFYLIFSLFLSTVSSMFHVIISRFLRLRLVDAWSDLSASSTMASSGVLLHAATHGLCNNDPLLPVVCARPASGSTSCSRLPASHEGFRVYRAVPETSLRHFNAIVWVFLAVFQVRRGLLLLRRVPGLVVLQVFLLLVCSTPSWPLSLSSSIFL